jgi:hypothetical protein
MLIHSGEGFDVFRHDGASPYLLVTFNEVGRLGDGVWYWGQPIVEAHNISTIGIASRLRDWFRNPGIDRFLAEHPDLFRNFPGDVVAVGYSMGAYGAIKYSRAINASTVVAICPQYTMDAAGMGDTRAPHKFFDPVLHRNMEPRPEEMSGRIYVLHDPHYNNDLVHVRALAATGHQSVIPVAVPFADHEVQLLFTEGRALVELIEACRSGDKARIGAFIRATRKRWPLRASKAALATAGKRPVVAARIYANYPAAFRPIDLGALAHRVKGRMPDFAERLFTRAIELAPKVEQFKTAIAALRRSRGARA